MTEKKSTRKSALKFQRRCPRSKPGQLPQILKTKHGTAYMNYRGRRYFLGAYGSEEAEWKRRQIVAEVEAGEVPAARPTAVTVLMLVVKFLDHAKLKYQKHGRSTGSYERFKITVKPLLRLYADLPADDFRPSALKTIRQEMVDAGLCRRITNQRVGFIKQIFAWGVGEELVDESTAARLKYVANLQEGMTPAVDYDPIPPVSMEIVEKTLPFCPHPIIADMIRVQMYAGMRPQDICNMRLCDIDRSGDVWEYHLWEHKTEHKMQTRSGKKQGLVRWLGPKSQEILETYILAKTATPEAFLFSPVDAVKYVETEKRLNRKTPVQPSQIDRSVKHPMVKPGEKYQVGSYRTAIHRACKRAGVTKWSPNQLRHTWATFVEKEYGPEAARIILGHKSVDTTMIYIERDNARGREIARKIG